MLIAALFLFMTAETGCLSMFWVLSVWFLSISIRGTFCACPFFNKIATSLNACFIASPFKTVGILFFAGYCNMWTMSPIASLMASISLYTGIGVVFGTGFSVSVSTSL